MDFKTSKPQRAPVWLDAKSGNFEEFQAIVSQMTGPDNVPLAAEVIRNIPIYQGADVDAAAVDPSVRQALMEEWSYVFAHGAGIIVIRQGVADHTVIDRATEIFSQIITDEKRVIRGGGDDFAKPGANDRVWNSLEKHCLADPANFAAYYSSHGIALASEAWLGPAYQMTAQVNRVNPGGAAQTAHRDYHLGFMTPEQITRYPAHIHAISPTLTLQGAVAHCDMPLETGPTMLLPFSQKFLEGYLAFARPEFQAHFAANHVQLALNKGDLMFFNPAVMHGAGTNHTSDRFRLADLLQVSSALGRAMESVDRVRMIRAIYPELRRRSGLNIANVIAATAEGYPFPTNLDSNPPMGGLAPKSQAAYLCDALVQGQSEEAFFAQLDLLQQKNKA